jgi:translation elongation factor P/translation initiation factor 5A
MEKLHYYEPEDTLVIETIYDPSALIEQNKAERAAVGKPRLSDSRLVKVASIDEDHIVALKNKGYNLMSSDKEEVRRALCYIQENEQVWMTVEGRPFAMWRPKWR